MESGRLGNAAWIPPAAFAERCPYEDGTFWVGRSPETGESLGYVDDRHIFLASGNRAGKGTTTILNNLCVWPGSVVVVDPKGENATVTAARRGKGSEYCEGMGQDVHVLDPFGASSVADEYRSRYNPLDDIDPNDPKVLRLTSKIADAIVVEQQGIKEPFWKDSARKMVKGIILHVLTSPRYEGRRNLVTVRLLINRGDVEGVETLRAAGKKGIPSGHMLLWEGMSVNEAVKGVIAGIGEQMAQLMQADAKLFHSMLQSVDRETEWLDDELIQRNLEASDFTLAELKSNPDGLSVYLCMPEGDMADYNRWIRMMLTLVVRVVEHRRERPACGHRILMVMDEFLALERIKAVERAASYIAGFHLTMLFVVQGLSPLQEIYGKGWENIIGNCGLKIFFAVDEPFAREYISKMIGDTEVRPDVHTRGSGTSTNEARTHSVSKSDTATRSTSRAVGNTKSKSSTDSTSRTNSMTDTASRSQSLSASRSRNRSRTDSINQSTADTLGSSQSRNRTNTLGWNDSMTDGTNWNQSHTDGEGSSESGSWSPRKLLFRNTDNWTHWLRENETKNKGSNKSSSDTKGSGGSQSTTHGRSGSTSDGFTDTQNQSHTDTLGRGVSHTDGDGESLSATQSDSTSRAVGVSDTEGHSNTVSEAQSVTNTVGDSKSHTHGETDGTTEGSGASHHESVSESVHSRRLVPAEDVGRLFDRPEPGKIGFALVIVGGGHPTVVVRAPYYNDPHFGWLFDPHPDHQEPPKLIGTERFLLPSSGAASPLKMRIEPLKLPGDVVERGEVVAELVEPISDLDDINEQYADYAPRVRPSEFGFPDPLPLDVRVPVYAQTDGEVVDILGDDESWCDEGDEFLVLEVNRRHLYENGLLDAGDGLTRYVAYLLACQDRMRIAQEAYEAEQRAAHAARLESYQASVTAAEAELAEILQQIEGNQAQWKELTDLQRDLDERAVSGAEQEFINEKSAWASSVWLTVALSAAVAFIVGGAAHAWMPQTDTETARVILAVIAGLFIGGCFAGVWIEVLQEIPIGEANKNAKNDWRRMKPAMRDAKILYKRRDLYALRGKSIEGVEQQLGELKELLEEQATQRTDRQRALFDAQRQCLEVKAEDPNTVAASDAMRDLRTLDRQADFHEQLLQRVADEKHSKKADPAETARLQTKLFGMLLAEKTRTSVRVPTEQELEDQQADFYAKFDQRLKIKPDQN